MSFDHFCWSDLINSENSSGLPPDGSIPRSNISLRTFGVYRTLSISALILETTLFGLIAGTKMPNQPTAL